MFKFYFETKSSKIITYLVIKAKRLFSFKESKKVIK